MDQYFLSTVCPAMYYVLGGKQATSFGLEKQLVGWVRENELELGNYKTWGPSSDGHEYMAYFSFCVLIF